MFSFTKRHPCVKKRLTPSAVGCIVRGETTPHADAVFDWVIPDISSKLADRNLKSIVSPVFRYSRSSFRLQVIRIRSQMGEIVQLRVNHFGCKNDRVIWNIGVRKPDGSYLTLVAEIKTSGEIFSDFSPLADLLYLQVHDWQKLVSEVVPSGKAVFRCCLKIEVPEVVPQRFPKIPEVPKETPPKPKGTDKLAQDLKNLLLNSDDSDATVRVKGENFRVHRAILGARTPVFSAMFRHDTSERASGVVVIDDCEPDVFREFLQYVYTGGVEHLTPEVATGLYRVADKYQVEELKERCLDCIEKGLSVSSFCRTVTLALTHDEIELTRLSKAFFADHIEEIISTPEWIAFLCENPVLANELMIEAHRMHKRERL